MSTTNILDLNNRIDALEKIAHNVEPIQQQIDEIKEDLNNLEAWTSADLKTVSGNPITLTDGSARNAEGLSVVCNPKQNLHGYDYPWAGGAGKNKMPITVDGIKALNTSGTWNGNVYTVNGMTFTILTDGDNNVTGIKIKNTPSATSALILCNMSTVLENGVSYTLTGCPSGGSSNTYSISAGSMGSDVGAGRTFTYDSSVGDKRNILFAGTSYDGGELTFYPMIRLASVSDATFEPYTNECPITGYTECVVDRDGKNKLEVTGTTATVNGITYTVNSDGTILAKGIATARADFYIVNSVSLASSTYILTYGDAQLSPERGIYMQWEKNGTPDTVVGSATFTEDQIGYIRLITASGTDISSGVLIKPMIRLASVYDATFEPYSHDTATITFGQTVYRAIVNPKTGKARVTHGIVDLGTLDYTAQTNIRSFYAQLSDAVTGATGNVMNAICSQYNAVQTKGSVADMMSQGDGIFAMQNGSKLLFIKDTSKADLTASQFADAMDGVQLCYELATPIELTLTPAELELLKGYNYITTNGNNIELTYMPDTLKADILLTVSQLYGSKIAIFDGILTGGDTGQVLTKTSDDNYDATWATLPATRTTTRKSEK